MQNPPNTPNQTTGTRGERFAKRGRALWMLPTLAGMLACAPTQMIGLDVGPRPLVVFVDGKALSEVPPSIELTANRDHKVFFSRDGYRSQLIIVRTAEAVDGEATLEPGHIQIRLKRIATTAPKLSIELDEPPGS